MPRAAPRRKRFGGGRLRGSRRGRDSRCHGGGRQPRARHSKRRSRRTSCAPARAFASRLGTRASGKRCCGRTGAPFTPRSSRSRGRPSAHAKRSRQERAARRELPAALLRQERHDWVLWTDWLGAHRADRPGRADEPGPRLIERALRPFRRMGHRRVGAIVRHPAGNPPVAAAPAAAAGARRRDAIVHSRPRTRHDRTGAREVAARRATGSGPREASPASSWVIRPPE